MTRRTTDTPHVPADSGQSPPPELLRRLEHGLRADLSAMRVHIGPAADRLARGLGAEAFASGSHVFFRRGAYRPHSPSGFRLLAHEAAHLVQQARGEVGGTGRGEWTVSEPGDPWEQEADRWADAVVRGRTRGGAPVVVPPGCSATVQRHVSFEHRILGDAPTDNLVAISAGAPNRNDILDAQIRLQELWRKKPESVTEQEIDDLKLGIETLRIGPGAGLLVTYGELNALPDYLADAGAFATVPKETLLGVLQCIRQEGFNHLTGIRTGKTPNDEFEAAASAPWKLGLVNDIVETASLDAWTSGLGFLGENHYQGLLARNACHFAPYSWFRWQTFHMVARDLAQRSYLAKKDKELARQALMFNGYADHFLQDSFAAGHLINKTLIMQWFIEWAAKQNLLPIADWDRIKNMTAERQPGLAGLPLYDPAYNGPSNDPQASQEASTLVRRVLGSRLVADKDLGLGGTYQNYLTFLTSAAAQLGSGMLHDHYNSTSVYVSSTDHPEPFAVWGDNTLLTGKNGSTGVEATSKAAQQSQQALREILAQGETGITIRSIRDRFPTRAGTGPKDMSDLKSWNTGQKKSCLGLFDNFVPQLKELLVGLANPRLGVVSRDQNFATVWNRRLPSSSTSLPAVRIAVANGQVFAGSNGSVYQIDQTSGKIVHSLLVTDQLGVGDYTTRLATDGDYLYAGVHGHVYGISLGGGWGKPAWASGVGGLGTPPVDVLAAGGKVFAGSNGYVYQIDPFSGEIVHSLLVTDKIGVGDYTTRLATDGTNLYVGVHGYVYGISLDGAWKQPLWNAGVGGPGTPAVDVIVADGYVFAGSNGYVYQIDPPSGKILRSLLVTDKIGVGDYTTTLATNGFNLFAGVHGYVYGISLDNSWNEPLWNAGVGGVGAFYPVSVNVGAGRVFAGSNGYAYEFDPDTGKLLNSLLLTLPVSTGGDYSTTVVTDGMHVYAGVHGYASQLLVNNSQVDGTLYRNWQSRDGGWHGWGQSYNGAPPRMMSVTAQMGANGNLEIFAFTDDGTLYHNWQGGDGGWHGWEPNYDGAPPGVQSVTAQMGANGNLEIFAATASGTLYHNWQGGDGGWHGWEPNYDGAPPGVQSVTAQM
ncbi:eCIS core domain-containing protein, partial [Streptomyces hayashii]|uniref:eCIS core domain-containing protein n=1 Tax=Streptomyces hayashii TaxID=2839966 RepID=UPI00403CF33F